MVPVALRPRRDPSSRRLSDAGPSMCRLVAIGRHLKRFTTTDPCTALASSIDTRRHERTRRHFTTKRLCSFEVDGQFVFGWRLHRRSAGFSRLRIRST